MWAKDTAALKPITTAVASPLSPTVHPEGIRDGEKQDSVPRQLRCISESDFREPRLLHLPTARKALTSLTGLSGFL